MIRLSRGTGRASSLRLILAATLLGLTPAGGTLVAPLLGGSGPKPGVERGEAAIPTGTLTSRSPDTQTLDRGHGPRGPRSVRSPRSFILPTPRGGAPKIPDHVADRALERSGRLSAPSTAPPILS